MDEGSLANLPTTKLSLILQSRYIVMAHKRYFSNIRRTYSYQSRACLNHNSCVSFGKSLYLHYYCIMRAYGLNFYPIRVSKL